VIKVERILWQQIKKAEFELSGVYLMIFPNGKKYLGKTNNLRRRLKEHLKAF
jgi:predicted GIY-YIG superfamily endonuclease